jgi:hypothetical protein
MNPAIVAAYRMQLLWAEVSGHESGHCGRIHDLLGTTTP